MAVCGGRALLPEAAHVLLVFSLWLPLRQQESQKSLSKSSQLPLLPQLLPPAGETSLLLRAPEIRLGRSIESRITSLL